MIKLVTVDEMRAIEAAADFAGVSYAQMMDNAGRAVAAHVRQVFGPDTTGLRVAVLVGPGNNGGDGLVAGRLLAEALAVPTFYLARPRDDDNLRKVREAGLRVIDTPDYEALRALVAGADVIIDALLGTGTSLPVRAEIKTILEQVRLVLAGRELEARQHEFRQDPNIAPTRGAPQKSRGFLGTPIRLRYRPGAREYMGIKDAWPYIVAVDIPSGMDADTGEIDPLTLRAYSTVTFEAAKLGHVSFPAAEYVGHLVVAPLDLPETLPERDNIRRTLVHGEAVAHLLPKRPLNANKGTFGSALIIGGSASYIGAPVLAAYGAYRSGAGLVTIAAPEALIPTMATHIKEATWLPLPLPEGAPPESKSITDAAASLAYTQFPNYDAVLIGPGMGRALGLIGFIESLLTFGNGKIPPLVIDADGLNMLATMDSWWPMLPPRTVLTPHPGEMARLAKIKGTDGESGAHIVQRDRLGIAAAKAKAWNCVVVLKGAFTVVADPDGRIAVQPFAEPALARAGTGDVLAGMVAALLAQGLDPFDAAVGAAYLHGYAGSLVAERYGRSSALAGDLIDLLPQAFRDIEGGYAE